MNIKTTEEKITTLPIEPKRHNIEKHIIIPKLIKTFELLLFTEKGNNITKKTLREFVFIPNILATSSMFILKRDVKKT